MGRTKDLHAETTKKSLYNITIDQQILMHEVELMDGELTPEAEEQLIINKSELEHKSIAYLAVIREKEASNTLIDNEIKRLQALKKRNTNILTRLEYNLLNAVKSFGAFEVGFNKFGTRKSSVVQVDDVGLLGSNYIVSKTTYSADKKLIKEDIKKGLVVKGAYIKENLNLKIN